MHYIPVDAERLEEDLPAKLAWARAHDAEARQIAANAQAFAREHLTPEKLHWSACVRGFSIAFLLLPNRVLYTVDSFYGIRSISVFCDELLVCREPLCVAAPLRTSTTRGNPAPQAAVRGAGAVRAEARAAGRGPRALPVLLRGRHRGVAAPCGAVRGGQVCGGCSRGLLLR